MPVDSCSTFRQTREVLFELVEMMSRKTIAIVAVIKMCFHCISNWVDLLLAPG